VAGTDLAGRGAARLESLDSRLSARWSQTPWLRPAAAVVAFGLVTALLAPIAYHWMFSLYATFDDEGGALVPLKEFLAQGNLYDQVYWQYGPLSFEVWGGIFKLLGLTVSHDSGRFVVLTIWLLASGLTGVVAYRATRSVLLAVVTQMLAFRCLITMANEPLHPDSQIALLGVMIAAAVYLALPRRPQLGLALLGALVACLSLEKINVGGFAILSTALALVVTYPALANRRYIRLAAEAAFVGAPTILMGAKFSSSWVVIFAAHVTIAALAVVLVLRTMAPDPDRRLVELRSLAFGFVAASAAVLVAATIIGTSPGGLFRGIITDPLQFPNSFSVPFRFPAGMLVFDALALGVCVLYVTRIRSDRDPGQWWRICFVAASIAAGVLIALTVSGFVFPNAVNKGSGRAELSMLALVWVALIPRPSARKPPGLPLVLLVALALLQTLHAYPVAGSQVRFGAFLLLPVAAICVANGLRELPAAFPVRVAPYLRLAALAIPLAFLVWTTKAVVVDGGDEARGYYDAFSPLKLPGSERIHLPLPTAQTLRQVTRGLRENCRTYFGMPGLDSFYLWARQDPPTSLNVGDWMGLWDSDKQRRALHDITGTPGLCLLRNDALASNYEQDGGFPDRPLYRWFTHAPFEPVARIGDYEILARASGAAPGPSAGRK